MSDFNKCATLGQQTLFPMSQLYFIDLEIILKQPKEEL